MIENIEKGSLEGRLFPFIVKEIYAEKRSGMLSLKWKQQRKFIFFKNGMITLVQSSTPDEQLGQAMLRGGVYDDELYGVILDLVRQGGWANRNLSNYISRQTIEWWMKSLVREVFLSLMKWESGEYRFFPGKNPPGRAVLVKIDAMRLLISSIRRIHPPDILFEWLGELDDIPKVHLDVLNRMGDVMNLTPTEGFFLSRIDGTMSFRQILTLSGSQKSEMLRFLVGGIFSGLISVEKRKPVQRLQRKPKETSAESASEEVKPGKETEQAASVGEEVPSERTEDVELTADELSELDKLAKEFGVDLLDVEAALDGKKKEKSKREEKVEISYLRDGEFVGGKEMGEAIDIDELKKKSASGSSRAWAKQKEKEQVDENKLTVWIKGREVDAETDFLGEEGVDFASGEDGEEQWNRWLYVDVDESDVDYMVEWETGWRTWQDHYRELQELKMAQEQVEAQIRAAKEAERLERLREHFAKINYKMERLINDKKREIILAHRRAGIQNYYEILHLTPGASQEEIEEAYRYWHNEYQPQEEYISEFETLAPTLNELFEKLQKAYEVLTDPEQKSRYDEMLEKQLQASKVIQEKKERLAKDHLMSARQALKRGDYMLAMRYLRGSISLDPKNPLYYHEMAEVLAENEAWWNEALKYYKRAFHLDPDNTELLMNVAELAIKMGLKKFAENALKHALSLNSGLTRARKMLNLLKTQSS